MEPLSLFELNHLVREALDYTFRQEYWIAAEISELRVANNGHCYLEFVEKEERSNMIIAKARANIWRNNYQLIAQDFEQQTGQRLQAGIKVLVSAQVTFHELYGYSLNILDIDPTYTLGDLAKRKKEILKQLEDDGVLTLNKELELPRLLSRIAVISSSTAAGYGDFCNQLEQTPFRFTTQLFPAIMQGERIEETMIAALNQIAAEMEQWDAVVIIRGGGTVSDLNGFDTYLLASNVAQFPLPILTGIGHERDDTVIDMVAHTRLKTPTAVAAFLIERQRDELEEVRHLEDELNEAVIRRLEQERFRFEQNARRFQHAATQYTGKQRERLLRLTKQLEMRANALLQHQHYQLDTLPQRLERAVQQQLSQEKLHINYLEKHLQLAGPERMLQMGFTLTTCNGKVIRNAAQLKAGDKITTQFAKGKVTSTVDA